MICVHVPQEKRGDQIYKCLSLCVCLVCVHLCVCCLECVVRLSSVVCALFSLSADVVCLSVCVLHTRLTHTQTDTHTDTQTHNTNTHRSDKNLIERDADVCDREVFKTHGEALKQAHEQLCVCLNECATERDMNVRLIWRIMRR